MPERKILLVCYYFPPLGGAGIGRPLALFEKLPHFNYDCHILTVKPVAYRVYEPALLDNLDKRKIYRAGSLDPQRLLYLLGVRTVKSGTIEKSKSLSDRFFPDPKAGWVKPAVKLGRTLLTNRKYDLIMSTSPPISAHLVAGKLSKEFNVPWAADFRDYWTSFKPENWYDNERSIKKAYGLMEKIRGEASSITTINETIAEYLGGANVIYNSYDDNLGELWKTPNKKDNFVVGLFGTFNELCPVTPLLEVLNRIRESSKHLFEKIRLLQVGDVDRTWLLEKLDEFDMADKCQMVSFQPRYEAVKLLSDCSLFYLGVPEKRDAGLSTGRIYLLLASGRPILAAVPTGSEIGKLVETSGNGFCFQDDNIEDAVEYLIGIIESFSSGTLNIKSLPDYAVKFSSENMVKKFAELFDTILSSG